MQVLVQDMAGALRPHRLPPACSGRQARRSIAATLGLPAAGVYLVAGGRCLTEAESLESQGVQRDALVQVACRLPGGGGDGGCHMVRRDCLLWVKGPAEKGKNYDKTTLGRILWTSCKKGNDRLRHPIVACELGFLYNKEAVLLALLDRTSPEHNDIRHIRKVSDLTQLIFERNPAWKEAAQGSESVDELIDQYLCPILHDVTSNGVHRFCFYRQCGHVVSQEAIKAMGSSACLVCQKPAVPWEEDQGDCENVILPLCSTDPEEVERLQERLAKRRAARKERDGAAKRKAKEAEPKRPAEAKDAVAPAPKKPKGAYIVGVPRGLALPSHHNVPANATPEVWKALFADSTAPKPRDDGFLVRAGMCGGGGGRNI
eukprot:EG_transcript_12802